MKRSLIFLAALLTLGARISDPTYLPTVSLYHDNACWDQEASEDSGQYLYLNGDLCENPLFDLRFGVNAGVAALDPNLTINSTTVAPSFRYDLGDADATDLDPWGYGETLTATGSGGSYNQGAPTHGTVDDSANGDGTRYYLTAGTTNYELTTDDFVIEVLVRLDSTGHIMSRYSSGNNGWDIIESSGKFLAFLGYGAGNAIIQSATLDVGSWYHAMLFVDRSGSAQWYVNGAASGSATSVSAVTSGIDQVLKFALLADPDGTDGYPGPVAYAAMWQGAGWLDTHLQATVAAERFARLTGVYPARAAGTAVPTVSTRASSAAIDKLESGVRQIYHVGDNWPRVVSRTDSNGKIVTGYLAEYTRTNLCLQSEDLSTTWAQIDVGDTVDTDAAEAPDKQTTADGLIADATDGAHGVTQAVTLTATPYTFSVFAEAGDQTHLILNNATVANTKTWFNLSTGTVGTTGASATAHMEALGDGRYRCGITFTGTAAAHTLHIESAEADNDSAFAGDGATVNTYVWGAQVDANEYMSSYIPTTTGTVARATDVLYYKADDGNYNVAGGKVVISYLLGDYNAASAASLLSLNDGGASGDRIEFGIYSASQDYLSLWSAATEAGNDILINPTTTDAYDGERHESTYTFSASAAEVLEDGISVGTDATVDVLPDDIDRITLGRYDSNFPINGVIERVRIYK